MSGVLAGRGRIAAVFLAFAFAYFLSTLVRAITATLSPTLTADFELHSRDLGLLAGAISSASRSRNCRWATGSIATAPSA